METLQHEITMKKFVPRKRISPYSETGPSLANEILAELLYQTHQEDWIRLYSVAHGTKVRVAGKVDRYEGWDNYWKEEQEITLGRVGIVTSIGAFATGVIVNFNIGNKSLSGAYPYFLLKVQEKSDKHEEFKDVEL